MVIATSVKVRHLCTAVLCIGIFIYLGMGADGVGRYCTRCGLVQETFTRTCFGINVHHQIRYMSTEYQRLYQRFISMKCNHRWWAYSLGHSCPPGYARLPYVLRDRYGAGLSSHLLTRLEDPAKIIAVLTSFDLAAEGSDQIGAGFEHYQAIVPAIVALKEVADDPGEEVWWAKYGHLFPGRVPPNLSL